MTSSRKHNLLESPSRPEAKRSDAGEQQSPWRLLRAAGSLASAARLAAAAVFRSPPRVAAAAGAAASGGEPRSQPRKLAAAFGEAATLPTAPAPSHDARMLAPDASLPEVAAFLCAGAHEFDPELP